MSSVTNFECVKETRQDFFAFHQIIICLSMKLRCNVH